MRTVITPTQQGTDRIVNAACVDVIDLGIVNKPWGDTPQVDLVFESDETDGYGEHRILKRTFNKYTNPMSALSIAVKNWCGRDLEQEEVINGLDLTTLIGEQVRLKLQPTPTRNGRMFDKLVDFMPPGEVHVQATKYRREQD